MNNSPLRIALVRLSALGDIVNSAIVLQMIANHFPHARIDWVTEEPFAPLLHGHPGIRHVHAVAIKRLKREKRLSLLGEIVSGLRTLGPYDLIIDMQGLLKSAAVARLIGRNIHGYDGASAREGVAAWFYRSHSTIAYAENIIRRNCRIVGDALGFGVSDEEILRKEPLFPSGARPAILEEGRPNVVCVIGASWPSKQYPKEQFARFCGLVDARCIVVWGNADELNDARWIAQHADNAVVAEKMDLKELCALIEHADLTVGNDTGPTHMAWAMNRPSIVLFGPTTPRMMFETPVNIAIESPSTVNIHRIDKNDFSIRQIDPELVAKRAKELLC